MEQKIGEIFEHNGEWYQCLEHTGCSECAFKGKSCDNIRNLRGECISYCRSDRKDVHFKKLEKVGEPFSCNYFGDKRLVIMQEYQLYEANAIYNYGSPPMYISDYKHKRIAIEIKQNKEDLEEKNESAEEISIRIANEFEEKLEKHFKEYMDKIDTRKLKPFDIQKAKEGRPVCTRDGRKVRIACFDKKGLRAIVGLVDDGDKETLMLYDEAGRSIGDVSEFDLMMLPEKKEGWVNVYKGIDGITFSKHPYPSKEEAIKNAGIMSNRIDTVKICWEE